MKNLILLLFCLPLSVAAQTVTPSPTEGVITSDFVSEADMKSDLLQMLANFST